MSGEHRRCLQTRAEGLWLAWEVYMAKHPSERRSHPERVPRVPLPSAASARDGAELAREEARRYLPDAVRLLAGMRRRLTARPLCTPGCYVPSRSWRLPA